MATADGIRPLKMRFAQWFARKHFFYYYIYVRGVLGCKERGEVKISLDCFFKNKNRKVSRLFGEKK